MSPGRAECRKSLSRMYWIRTPPSHRNVKNWKEMAHDATYISTTKDKEPSWNRQNIKMTVLSQIFKLIPRNLIPKIANDFGIDRQSRVFSPTSHVLALVFGQLTHALGLNDICDTLRNHCGFVSKIRDCVPPSRNGLSHANRNRDAGMAEKLFGEVEIDVLFYQWLWCRIQYFSGGMVTFSRISATRPVYGIFSGA